MDLSTENALSEKLHRKKRKKSFTTDVVVEEKRKKKHKSKSKISQVNHEDRRKKEIVSTNNSGFYTNDCINTEKHKTCSENYENLGVKKEVSSDSEVEFIAQVNVSHRVKKIRKQLKLKIIDVNGESEDLESTTSARSAFMKSDFQHKKSFTTDVVVEEKRKKKHKSKSKLSQANHEDRRKKEITSTNNSGFYTNDCINTEKHKTCSQNYENLGVKEEVSSDSKVEFIAQVNVSHRVKKIRKQLKLKIIDVNGESEDLESARSAFMKSDFQHKKSFTTDVIVEEKRKKKHKSKSKISQANHEDRRKKEITNTNNSGFYTNDCINTEKHKTCSENLRVNEEVSSDSEVEFIGQVNFSQYIKKIRKQLRSEIKDFNAESTTSVKSAILKSDFQQNEHVHEFCNMLEHILGFRPPLIHIYSFIYPGKTMNRASQIERTTGVKIKKGPYTTKEDNVIKRNLKDFMDKHNLDDYEDLLGLYIDHYTKSKYKDIKRNDFFPLRLAKGFNFRPVYSIYERARTIFDPFPKKGRCGDEEFNKIMELKNMLGSKWNRISRIIGRSRNYLASLYNYRGKIVRKGPWTMKEERLLSKIITKHLKVKDSPVGLRKLPWTQISKYISSRNSGQCRRHWLSTRCYQPHESLSYKWSKTHDIHLIYFMYSHMVQEENFVDWDAVFHSFRYAVPYMKLKYHWHKLKKTVPEHSTKDHEDIVLYLYHAFLLPRLPQLNLELSDLKNWLKQGELSQKI